MTTPTRDVWLVQIQFEDKELLACPMTAFKRRLKGTGFEIDTSYPLQRVAPGRFVGRGLATRKASSKIQFRRDIQIFKEIRISD